MPCGFSTLFHTSVSSPFIKLLSIEVCHGFLLGPSLYSPLLWRMLIECLLCARHSARLRDMMVNKTDQITATMKFSEGERK